MLMKQLNEKLFNKTKLIKELKKESENQLKGSETGTEIDLIDAFDTRLRYLEIDATETKQETTTGKNKLKLTNQSITAAGLDVNITDNNVLSYNGTATNSFINVGSFENCDIPLGQYTFSIDGVTSGNERIVLYTKGDTDNNFIIQSGSKSITVTLNDKKTTYRVGLSNLSIGSSYSGKFKMQLKKGSASDYEPYTGEQPSPSPDYPQDVETMVGYKNEFDTDDFAQKLSTVFTIVNKDEVRITRKDSTTTYTYSLNCKEKTQYNFKIKFKATFVDYYISFVYSDGTTQTIAMEKTYSNYVDIMKISNSNNTIIGIKIELYGWGILYIKDIQLTEGTEEKPYVPYGTNYMLFDEVGKNCLKTIPFSLSNFYGVDISCDENGVFTINGTGYTANAKLNISGEKIIYWYGGTIPSDAYTNIKLSGTYTIYLEHLSGTASKNTRPAINIMRYNENRDVSTLNSISPITTKTDVIGGVNIMPGNITYTNYKFRLMIVKGTYNISTIGNFELYQHKQYPISLGNQELLNKGDYVDKIIVDEKTGESYIEKIWDKIVLDGSENWQQRTNSNNVRQFYCGTSSKNLINAIQICNYFNNYNQSLWNWGSIGNFAILTNNKHFVAGVSNDLTLDEFKEKLNEKPLICYYVLATPQLIKIPNPNIKLLNGVNHITNSEGAEMDIVYVKDINIYLENELSNIKNAIVSLGGDI